MKIRKFWRLGIGKKIADLEKELAKVSREAERNLILTYNNLGKINQTALQERRSKANRLHIDSDLYMDNYRSCFITSEDNHDYQAAMKYVCRTVAFIDNELAKRAEREKKG